MTKVGLLGSLYLAQGLPFGFFTQTVPVVLREQGWSLDHIGLASLLALPWALKFLWAPLVDRYAFTPIGRRRTWILPLQISTFAVLVALAYPSVENSVGLILGAVLLLNLVAATQDIATDGLAVDLLQRNERGLGNGLQVAGYRVGMIIGGGLILIALDKLGWSTAMLLMAVAIALATIPITRFKEGSPKNQTISSTTTPTKATGPHFLRTAGAVRILVIVVLFKLGDALGGGMLRPLLVDTGYSLSEIGMLVGGVGFVAGLLGALIGGTTINLLGRRNALLLFGIAQSVAVGSYALITIAPPGAVGLALLIGFEHLTGGAATATLFTCMMDWSRPQTAATDYTVQASAVVVATGLAATMSGFSAQILGWESHFIAAGLLSAAGAAVAAALYARRGARNPRRQTLDSRPPCSRAPTARAV